MNKLIIWLLCFFGVLLTTESIQATDMLNTTPPVSRGSYHSGTLEPNSTITFDGSGSYDTDYINGGSTPKWRWDFDYDGSFSANKTTTSALTTWQYSQPGTYTVAVRYYDNDNESGFDTFKILVKDVQRRYYIKDHLGSIRTTVDEDGNVSGYDDYYPFGLAMPGRSSNTGNPNDDVKFTGYELDDEANLTLYHANARRYDPVIGRFLSVDPLASEYPSLSPFVYVSNNPLYFVDPTGMWIQYLDEDGIVRFEAEEGDDFNTFRDQYGMNKSEATEFFKQHGLEDYLPSSREGFFGKIADALFGKSTSVFETGSAFTSDSFLKAEIGALSDQQLVDQLSFAFAHSLSSEKDALNLSEYFSGLGAGSQVNRVINESSNTFIRTGDENIPIRYLDVPTRIFYDGISFHYTMTGHYKDNFTFGSANPNPTFRTPVMSVRVGQGFEGKFREFHYTKKWRR